MLLYFRAVPCVAAPLAETADLPVEATHPARRSGEGSVCQMSDPSRDGEELVTRRLSLRRPAPADVHAIFSIHSDQRACAHNPSDMLATRDEAHQLFRRWDEHWLRFGFGYWVVRRRDSATPSGFCGIRVMQLNESDVVNLFYRFDPAVWGSGLASEAASAVTGWAAQNIPARALIARIRPQNVASQRVAIHAGLARAEHMDALGEDGVDWIFVPTSGLQVCGAAQVAKLWPRWASLGRYLAIRVRPVLLAALLAARPAAFKVVSGSGLPGAAGVGLQLGGPRATVSDCRFALHLARNWHRPTCPVWKLD
jgi:[ribosomal protein S5]-alanine N-acetyltransferase